MKRLAQIVSTLTLVLGLSAGVASAATVTCGISNTGPGSNNSVTCETSNHVSVSCDNKVIVENKNGQTANSGNGSVSGNTSGGFTTTGTASNNNTAIVSVGASCAPVQTASTPSSSNTSQPAAGKGGSTAAPTASSAASGVSALPETGSNTALVDSAIGLAALVGVTVASRFGVSAYRHHFLK